MLTENRRSSATLVDRLYQSPHQFDFFQAVRLLECLNHSKSAKYESNMPFSVGYDRPQEKEIVRFRPVVSLQFPASQITKLVWRTLKNGKSLPPEMIVTFMGLTGPSGVLPVHYTRELLNRFHQKDDLLREFFDLFNHRIISFYYRAWEKYHFYATYERTHRYKKEDKFTKVLSSLVGMGTPGLHKRLSLKDDRLLFYAGLFSAGSRNATSLARMLSEYFKVPMRIKQFIAERLKLPLQERTRLGTIGTLGQFNQLNQTAFLGGTLIQTQHRFRIKIGPLSPKHFKKFLPTGSTSRELKDIVYLYAGEQYAFDVQLILKNEAYAGCHLFSKAQAEPARLGWNTWLGRPRKALLDDLVLAF